jgi:putative acetyltransferase
MASCTTPPIAVIAATTAPRIATVRTLMAEYGQFIAQALGPAHVCHTSIDAEIAAAERIYGPPRGFLLLATHGDRAIGCVAVHEIACNRAEIKRLWVQPNARGLHAGAALLDAALSHAKDLAYAEAVLDTVPAAMPAALRLYLSRGFQPTVRFNDNPVPGVEFFRRPL